MAIFTAISQNNPNIEVQAVTALGWRELAAQRPSPVRKRRRRTLSVLSVLLIMMLIFAGVRLSMLVNASNDQLFVRIGSQQVATIDLRQSLPINPDLLGVTLLPESGTSSLDGANGSMEYTPALTASLADAHIKLLRFPGGNRGESHILSFEQLSAFSTLLQQLHADGMVQARLSGPIGSTYSELADITNRTNIAGNWVDFLNNPRSDRRIGKFANAPFHPIKFWTVGNEPDKLINSATGKLYLVSEYVQDFIQFSTVMHRADPTIKIFGPEISEFYGPGAGPVDASGQLWMEGFLKGIGAYEQTHNVTLLDGISFQRYQSIDAQQAPYGLLSSTGEWNYLLPALHQLISQNLKHDLPLAVTEMIPIPVQQQAPTRGLAALWWADTLGTLMNQQVEYIASAAATGIDTTYPFYTGDSQQETPLLRVMQLFSHLQYNLIPLEVQRDPISVYATQDDTHQTVGLLFINKSASMELAHLSSDTNLLAMSPLSPWPNLDVSLMGHSMTVVSMHRSGMTEAYSYIAPASDDASTTPVMHSICGQKTDPLANNIPC